MKKKHFEYFICIQLLLLSGGLVYFIEYSRITVILWLISCFFYYIKYKQPYYTKTFFSNIKIYAFIAFWSLFSTYVVNGGNVQNNILFTNLLIALGSVLFMSSIGFGLFRQRLLKIATLLFSLSLVVHILHVIKILPATPIDFGGVSYMMSLFFFHTEWGSISTPLGEIYRFSSIFWEVGQAQIVIIFILVLYIDDICDNIRDKRYLLKKYGVLLLSLLMTGSTTGYLVLCMLIGSLLFLPKNKQLSAQNGLFIALFSVLMVFGLLSSSIVGDKFQDDNSSYAIRTQDNLVAIEATLLNPVFGLGCETKLKQDVLLSKGTITNSNGWLNASCSLGVTYVLFLIFVMYKKLKKMFPALRVIFLLAALIVSQCNEYFIHFPYLFLYIFSFKDYKHFNKSGIECSSERYRK